MIPETQATQTRLSADDALRLIAAHRLDEAQTLCQRILKQQPHHPGALHALGIVLIKRRQYPEAVDALERAIVRDPNNPQFFANLGEALRRSGKPAEALEAYRKAFILYPEFLGAHLGMANSLRDLGRLPESIAQLRVAVAIDRKFAEGYHYLGLALKDSGDQAGALAVLRKAVGLRKQYGEAELSLANLLDEMGKWEEAVQVFRHLLDYMPGSPAALNNLGNVYRILGRMEDAAACYKEILDKDPNNAQARYNLSRTGTGSDGDRADLQRMQDLLASDNLSASDRVSLHFSLGKIYDDLKDYDQAFHHFSEGNRQDKRPPDYDGVEHDKMIERIMAVCSADFFAARRGMGSESARPILIVGMPRSGTTLTEQILASHPEVFAGGERPALPDLTIRLGQSLKGTLPYPENLAQLDALTACKLAEDYLDGLPTAALSAKRVTDKLPANFHHVGLFALLFPNARIVHCRRNPLDTCLSCYFQHFSQVMAFSRSQETLAHYYRSYLRLMEHWRQVTPLAMLELDYEEMVADQEGQSRRLLDFCGLEWNDACLRFFETERAVKTASVWQVRQPMYDSSVGRWKNYEKHIAPLRAALEGVRTV